MPFATSQAVLPDDVIVGIAYNTTTYGENPVGPSACSASAAGCGYDALNVALDGATPTIGTQPDPDSAYWNTVFASNYCDGGAGGTGTFRLDTGGNCWTGYQPVLEVNAAE